MRIRKLDIRFEQEVAQRELPSFRGAVIQAMESANVLFHNHEEDGFRYGYPLIQYKRIGSKAAIICIGDGTAAIGEFFSNCDFDINIGERPLHLEVSQVKAEQVPVQVGEDLSPYTLRKWLPLNQENYQEYKRLEGLSEQCAFLERILTGNILSFASGLDIHFDREVKVRITALENIRTYSYKGVKMQGFDVQFKSNVSLPDYIGLGKSVSVGFGMVKRNERGFIQGGKKILACEIIHSIKKKTI